jgi:hypothetical protein
MKTLMVSFQPKWARMILSGEKKYEFRQGNFVNAKTGDKFLILESLGKISKKVEWYQHQYTDKDEDIILFKKVNKKVYDALIGTWYHKKRINTTYEGTGKVIGEFIVGEVLPFIGINNTEKNGELVMYQNSLAYFNLPRKDMKKIGWNEENPQPLAFEITQLKVYDTPRDKSEFIIESKYNNPLISFSCDNFFHSTCLKKSHYDEKTVNEVKCKSDCHLFTVKRSPQSFCRVIDTKTVI